MIKKNHQNVIFKKYYIKKNYKINNKFYLKKSFKINFNYINYL